MKVKHIIAIFLFGLLFLVIGSYLKITHHPYADFTFKISTVLNTIAILLGIWKVFTSKRFKEFLNS